MKAYFKPLLPILITFFTIGCINKEPFQIIKIKGKGTSINYSKSYFGYVVDSDSLHPAAIMADHGDVLSLGEWVYYNSDPKQTEIDFINDLPFFKVNGKINNIELKENNRLVSWFKQMKPSDIKDLQWLNIPEKIPDDYYPYIKKIAALKPEIGLYFGATENKMLLRIFKPKFLMGYNGSLNDTDLVSCLSNLEFLTYTLNDDSLISPIPALPKLKELIISSDKRKAYRDLLKNNRQIEKLTILGGIENDFFLQPLGNLKQLHIALGKDKEEKIPLGFLKAYKQLEVLNLNGSFSDLESVNSLLKLRWLSLLTETNQKELDNTVEFHKNLEVLELMPDSTLNLHVLLKLKKLYGLTLVNQNSIDTTVYSMKNLKYLSLSRKVFKNEAKIASLKKSLPSCTIVPNDGFCLGSVWLLLLLPFILIFRLFLPKKGML
jgi:hypothetical protein